MYVHDAQQDADDDAHKIKMHMQSYRFDRFAITLSLSPHSSNIIGVVTTEPLTTNSHTPDNAAMLVAVKVGRVAKEEAIRGNEQPSILCLDRVQATCLDNVCTGRHCARAQSEANYQTMQPAIVNRFFSTKVLNEIIHLQLYTTSSQLNTVTASVQQRHKTDEGRVVVESKTRLSIHTTVPVRTR